MSLDCIVGDQKKKARGEKNKKFCFIIYEICISSKPSMKIHGDKNPDESFW